MSMDHTNIKPASSLFLLLPMALLLGAVVLDLCVLAGWIAAPVIQYAREALIILSLVLSLPIVYKQKWASDRNVLRGFRSLFVLICLSYLLFLVSDLDLIASTVKTDGSVSLYNSAGRYLIIAAWALFSSIFVLVVLGTLRNLIFIKQKRNTALNFFLLMLAIVLYAILSILKFGDIDIRFAYGIGNGMASNVLLFVLINLMVINSFRVTWLNYLNKKQKLAIFWAGLVLVPVQWLLHLRFHESNPAAVFSPVLGRFVDMGLLFLSIYLTVAFIALILHLPTAQLYDRKMRQISSLYHVSRAVSSEFDLQRLVETIVRLAREVTEADSCWLAMIDPETQKWNLAASLNVSDQEKKYIMIEGEDRLTTWLVLHREPLLINHVAKSPFRLPVSLWKPDIQSLLAAPLIAGDKVLGCLFVGKRMEYSFEQEDLDTLRTFGEQVVIAIENARLVEESLVKERLEQELRIAHDAQMKLLPKEMPDLPGIELAAICMTANEVGGDYYDFFNLPGGNLGIVVGDVSGKGPSAAFIMAELKGIMEAFARQSISPKDMLISANKILYNTLDRNTFVSVIYGIWDAQENLFTFCRAGQCPLMLVEQDAEKAQVLEPYGMGLGLDQGEMFADSLQEVILRVKPGDAVLLYTDGAVEARNTEGQEFGEQALNEAFHRQACQPVDGILQSLVGAVTGFMGSAKQHDDLTFVILKRK